MNWITQFAVLTVAVAAVAAPVALGGNHPGPNASLPAKAKAYGRNSPRAACVALPKKHVAGQNGTPFSRCVVAGAKLLKDQHKQNA